jgi:[ribosomal protein S5]-alanine N-acetyltransferase
VFGFLKAQGPQLSGARVFLRLPANGDFRAWAELRAQSRDELVPFEPRWSAHELTRAAFSARVRVAERLAEDGAGYNFLIFEQPGGVLAGGITLGNIRRGAAQAAEIGYWLGTPFSGRGLMTEAVGAVVHFAFNSQRLQRVEAACIQENTRSETLLKRCGFHYEGVARQYLEINGSRRDHRMHARLATDA